MDLRDVSFDQNGHLASTWPSSTTLRVDIGHVREHVQRWPGFPAGSVLQLYHPCTWCGQRPTAEFDLDAETVRFTDPCPAVDGVPMVNEIDFPSGRIIVSDDLRPVYRLDDEITARFHDYNTCLGQAEYSAAMFGIGCAYGPTLSVGPTLYRVGQDKYQLVIDSDEDEPAGEPLASVCADLWAYSIADYTDWTGKGGQVMSWTETVVDLTPGRYRFTHHTGERGFDLDGPWPLLVAEFELITP